MRMTRRSSRETNCRSMRRSGLPRHRILQSSARNRASCSAVPILPLTGPFVQSRFSSLHPMVQSFIQSTQSRRRIHEDRRKAARHSSVLDARRLVRSRGGMLLSIAEWRLGDSSARQSVRHTLERCASHRRTRGWRDHGVALDSQSWMAWLSHTWSLGASPVKPVKSLEQRRVELIEMLGEATVIQMEKEFDEYMIYGTRRSQENPAPLTGIFDSPKESKT